MNSMFGIEILVTRKCNFNCRYCDLRSSTLMSLGTAKKIINFIKKKVHKKKFRVILAGGEPLLNFKIVEYLIKKVRKIKGKKASILVLTNGSLLNMKSVIFFRKYDVSVQISIDGSERMHNRNRPLKGNRASYQKVMAGLDLLKKNLKEDRIIVNAVIPIGANISKSYIEEFFNALINLNVKRVDFDLDFNKMVVEKRDVQRIYSYIFSWADNFIKINKKTPPFLSIKTIFNDIYRTNKKKGKSPSYICQALANSLKQGFDVDADGKVYPCLHFVPKGNFEKGYDMGDISKINIKKHTLFSKSAVYFNYKYYKNSVCKNCLIRKYCPGPCIGLNYRSYKNFFPQKTNGCDLRRAQFINALKVYRKVRNKEIFNK